MCVFGPSGGGGGSQAARDQEFARQSRINAGMHQIDSAFQPYNDAYYKDYESKYIAASRPDLDKQQKEANEDVLFGLARTGNTRSSIAAKSYGDVVDKRAQTDLQVADAARGASAEVRGGIEATRSNLVNQLNSTANDTAAANAARAEALTANRAPIYSPITNAFGEITNQFAMSEQNRRAGNPGWGFGIASVDPIKGSRSSVREVA